MYTVLAASVKWDFWSIRGQIICLQILFSLKWANIYFYHWCFYKKPRCTNTSLAGADWTTWASVLQSRPVFHSASVSPSLSRNVLLSTCTNEVRSINSPGLYGFHLNKTGNRREPTANTLHSACKHRSSFHASEALLCDCERVKEKLKTASRGKLV